MHGLGLPLIGWQQQILRRRWKWLAPDINDEIRRRGITRLTITRWLDRRLHSDDFLSLVDYVIAERYQRPGTIPSYLVVLVHAYLGW